MTERIQHLEYDQPVLRYHEIVAQVVADVTPPNGSVLDVGCGLGQTLEQVRLARSDISLFGVDGDEVCLEATQSRVPTCSVKLGDISAVSDVDFAGRLLVAVPNIIQPIFLGRALVRRDKTQEGHYYAWDKATFENFCRLAGFEIEASLTDYVPLTNVRLRQRFPQIAKVERSLTSVVPQLTNSHITILRPLPSSVSVLSPTSAVHPTNAL